MKNFVLPSLALLLLAVVPRKPAKTTAPAVKAPEFISGERRSRRCMPRPRLARSRASIPAGIAFDQGFQGNTMAKSASGRRGLRRHRPALPTLRLVRYECVRGERGISWGGEDSYALRIHPRAPSMPHF